jgi:hypothetical protein
MRRYLLTALPALFLLVLPGENLFPAPPWRPPTTPSSYRDLADEVVNSWYLRFLGRGIDPTGMKSWAVQLRRGADPTTVLAGILGSDEYYDLSGNTSQNFVNRLYLDVARRRPNPRELDAALRRLRVANRQDVAYEVLSRFPDAVFSTLPRGYEFQRPFLPR